MPDTNSSSYNEDQYSAVAKAALLELTPENTIGDLTGHVEEDGAITVTFAARMSGYPGWHWTVSVAQVEGSEPTALEVELMPGNGALLAPDWVPWSERLAEYQAAQELLGAENPTDDDSDDDDADEDDTDELDDDSDDDSDDSDDDDDDPLGSDVLHGGDLDGVDIDDLDESDDDDSDDDDDDSDDDVVDDEDVDDDEDDADDDVDDDDADDLEGDDDDDDDDDDDPDAEDERTY